MICKNPFLTEESYIHYAHMGGPIIGDDETQNEHCRKKVWTCNIWSRRGCTFVEALIVWSSALPHGVEFHGRSLFECCDLDLDIGVGPRSLTVDSTIADKRNGTPLGFAHFKIGTFFLIKEGKTANFPHLFFWCLSIFIQKFGAIPHPTEKLREFEKEETWWWFHFFCPR